MTKNPSTYDEIARKVLGNYGLSEPRISFIRHSDTVTYKVITKDVQAYLLRIHIPITLAMGTHGDDFEMVNSEVAWMEAIERDTNLAIQKPIRDQSGALITRIPREDGSTVNCTLLRWVDGEPYHRELESDETAFQIGAILATLHNHASGWEIPDGFTRPVRDQNYFRGVLNGLGPAVKDGRVCEADFSELSQSISLLNNMIGGLDEIPAEYGILHGDAHKGNMIYDEGKIRLIDFSFCAFGNYMFDLAICLSDMKKELHETCLQGYQSIRRLPSNHQLLIEGYFIGSVVGTFSFWVANPKAQEILAQKVPQITRDYAMKFNQNEHFWF